MDNDEILGHLLKIESEAIALVHDAQAEADRRVLEAEKLNHAAYDERYAAENEKLENEFRQLQEEVRRQYQAELDAYRQELSSVNVDTDRFADLLDTLVTGAV
jgi:F0F1-type ATP synthase membrane subunit b/b'